MPLPELTRRLVEQKLGEFCERRVPPRARDQVRLSFSFRGNSVTLFEERVPWRGEGEWTKMPVAQLRFDADEGEWRLYCSDRNGKWHWYSDLEPTAKLDDVLKEIDEDPTGIFWG
ncbi:DUF3024 domain-containing protein [Myxococcota bacterium]